MQNPVVALRRMLVAGLIGLGVVASAAAGVSATRATSTAVHATLAGADRAPVAGRRWDFVLRARDAAGHPVRAVARVDVTIAGAAVDTVGRFAFTGVLRRGYHWSPALVGARAKLRATVTADGATTTVSYPVRVVAYTGRPQFVVRLQPESAMPRAGHPWRFAVYAHGAHNRPVGGTIVMRVAVRGHIVDTLGWFKFDGTLRRTYSWSRVLKGSFALLQARVIGPGGTRTVGHAIRVL